MTTLTTRFLAYNAKPKRPRPPPAPKQHVHYTIEGFLTPTETVLERMARLVEARARGEWLSKDNMVFFCGHRRIHFGPLQFKMNTLGRKQLLRSDRMLRRIEAETRAPYQGGRCD